jgi:hypothetical protein
MVRSMTRESVEIIDADVDDDEDDGNKASVANIQFCHLRESFVVCMRPRRTDIIITVLRDILSKSYNNALAKSGRQTGRQAGTVHA